MQPLGHVTAAVQMRIVDQPFPANGSARLFHIGAHHQQQLVADFVHQRGQALGVFQRGDGIVQGTGPDDDQQARIVAVEYSADGVAVVADACGKGVAQGQTLAQYGGAWQRLCAAASDAGFGGGGGLFGKYGGGCIHDLAVPSAGAGGPRRRYSGVRSREGCLTSKRLNRQS